MLLEILKTAWRYLLEVSGQNEYRRYCTQALARGETPLAPSAFYLSRLELKYSRPNRCC